MRIGAMSIRRSRLGNTYFSLYFFLLAFSTGLKNANHHVNSFAFSSPLFFIGSRGAIVRQPKRKKNNVTIIFWIIISFFCSLFLCSISLVVVLTRDLTESSEREDVTNFFLFPFQLGLFREWRQLSSTLLYFYLWPVNFQVVIGSHNNFHF